MKSTINNVLSICLDDARIAALVDKIAEHENLSKEKAVETALKKFLQRGVRTPKFCGKDKQQPNEAQPK